MFLRLLLTLSLALVLASCDTQPASDTQEQGALAPAKASLSGVIDRSHAGELMPAVSITGPSGDQVSTGAMQGSPMLLNLWATWCAPCVVEMPMLDDLAGEFGTSLRVVTVSQDLQGAAKVKPFFAKQGFRHLQPWLDTDNALGFALGGGVLPTTVLYDADGREVWRVVGEYDWSSAAAREAIAETVK